MRIDLEGFGKAYGGVPVLRDVSFSLRGGRVHGLLGENGAGKSTLLKAVCGAVAPDTGRVLLDGRPISIGSPRDALRHGFALISQELALVPALTVLDNVYLGRWRNRLGWRTRAADARAFAELAERTGFDLDPGALVRDLPLAAQQQVEILRALASGAKVIGMDEPTALLTKTETDRLLAVIRQLAAEGAAVVLISHFLEEVLSVCDDVTVLRDGRHVITGPAADQTPDSLVRHMVGRPLDVFFPDPAPVAEAAPVVLRARDVRRGAAVRGVSLDIRAGEIVGVAGLVGSGRSETLRAIFGADHRDGGEVELEGRPLPPGSPPASMRAGLAMVPESRKEQGLVLGRSVRENIALASLGSRQLAGFVRGGAEGRAAGAMLGDLDVRGSDLAGPVWTLSGGNQQKVLFGKWLLDRPKVLLVDEPTRGVDVAAKSQIHRLLVDLAADGMGVLMVSSEVEEVLGLAHRVLVMRHGRVVGEFARGEVTREQVLALAFADTPSPTAAPATPPEGRP
ncbi:ribose transport system ATP-binding protein [Thermocatellispora tengchongensis]|uniref:Ribose transport system ATP-binding protein n=1 Tax=Thermocatellispora tengchongensis TaxID=1073253 RepID=A0A840P653_9ACTN|nr:sugar ABC transporter ATP-binding protein [Thermocatellispora tengchongensis]MBB5132950.1 ribose transport system ATP-binding protein [Thermocatellispora tengchongensis]